MPDFDETELKEQPQLKVSDEPLAPAVDAPATAEPESDAVPDVPPEPLPPQQKGIDLLGLLLNLCAILLIAAGTASIYGSYSLAQSEAALKDHGKLATATVVAKEARRSGTFRSYQLTLKFKDQNGTERSVLEFAGSKASYDKTAVGSTLPLTYLPEDPSIRSSRPDKYTVSSSDPAAPFVLILGGILTLCRRFLKRLKLRWPAPKLAPSADAEASGYRAWREKKRAQQSHRRFRPQSLVFLALGAFILLGGASTARMDVMRLSNHVSLEHHGRLAQAEFVKRDEQEYPSFKYAEYHYRFQTAKNETVEQSDWGPVDGVIVPVKTIRYLPENPSINHWESEYAPGTLALVFMSLPDLMLFFGGMAMAIHGLLSIRPSDRSARFRRASLQLLLSLCATCLAGMGIIAITCSGLILNSAPAGAVVTGYVLQLGMPIAVGCTAIALAALWLRKLWRAEKPAVD